MPFRGVDFTMSLDRPGHKGRHTANGRYVDAAYFSVMKIPLKSGRMFAATDTTATTKVMLVSESFAKSVFGTANPLGQVIDTDDPTTIVGVVGDVRYVGRDLDAVPASLLPAHTARARADLHRAREQLQTRATSAPRCVSRSQHSTRRFRR